MADDEPERSRLIDAHRRANAAPPARRERVLGRLLAAGDVAVFVGGARPTGAPWAVILLGVAAAVLAVLALEVITGGVAAHLGQAPRFEAADGAERVRTGALASPGGPEAGAGVRAPAPAELPAVPSTGARPDASWADVPVQRPRSIGASTPVPAAAPIDAAPMPAAAPSETALIDEAHRAMRRRGWVDARNALKEHAAAFPAGAFAEERRALLVVIACRLDPSEETRVRAREFLVQEPGSPFLSEVTSACRPTSGVRVVSPFD